VAARPEIEELLRRALAYPYEPPVGSFVQVGDRTEPVPPRGPDLAGRRALLSYGANAAPEALTRKLAALEPRPLPVLAGQLSGFDVVYSAHVTRYGAVPAALVASPGTTASIHLVFPDEEQLAALAATEGQNYALERLTDFTCELEVGAAGPAEIDAFLSVHGPLLRGGQPIALAAIPARGRRFPALSTPEVIELVRAELMPELDLTQFILRFVEHGGLSPLPELTSP
jgi:hypothetical protein